MEWFASYGTGLVCTVFHAEVFGMLKILVCIVRMVTKLNLVRWYESVELITAYCTYSVIML